MYRIWLRTATDCRPAREMPRNPAQINGATQRPSPLYNRPQTNREPPMPNLLLADLGAEIQANVRRALQEDVGSGDITAQLIPAERLAHATIITRDSAV